MSSSRLSNAIAVALIVVVACMVGYANWRDARSTAQKPTLAPPIGSPGGGKTSAGELDNRIRDMEARLKARPDDTGAAVLLADALLRQIRVKGNPGLAIRAEALLKGVIQADPADYEANRMLGTLYLSQHRFRDAIVVAETNRAARPLDPVNFGVLGDARVELGEYDRAFAAIDEMNRMRPGAAAYARSAYARELQGNLDGALEAMKLAADATNAEDLEGLAWAHAQVGDLQFHLGRLEEAKQAYALASQYFPGHPFAVIGYARVVQAEGDFGGAINLLKALQTRSPTPDVAAMLGDLFDKTGDHDSAEKQYALAEAGWRFDAPEPKRLARFLADRGQKIDEAVKVAERAAADRDDIFTNDAQAWAYFKAGRLADAAKCSERALRTGTRDREILFHAAAIKAAQGDTHAARQLAARALEGNPAFDLVSAPAARHLLDSLSRS